MTTDSGEIRRNVLRNRRWFLRHGGAAVRPPSRSTEKSWLHFRPPRYVLFTVVRQFSSAQVRSV